ncbi:HMG box-containing protein 4-like isoform X2 [Thalassophryne amazonica]|nr:HMG box-containing protein 4-like isoform X2 [Thalassophryne amazonica]
MLEHWEYVDEQSSMMDCPVTRPFPPPGSPLTHRPYPIMPTPTSVASTTGYSISLSPGSTGSASDSLGSTPWNPVSTAAYLHLLGESLSLIGYRLQDTNKMVSVSSSLSLLLDSLLCALAPLICLTSDIPELSNCTQHTLVATLENIDYLMPGL